MKFADEFRNIEYAKKLVEKLNNISTEKINIMEVCGTHTMAIFRYGIRDVLPPNINLISGPGCPVCVTPQSYIDAVLTLCTKKDVIIATFGDMMRVPGKEGSLNKKKEKGFDIRIVYSPMDCLAMASQNPSKKIVFLSVGFETTAPMTSLTVIEAKKNNIKNLFFATAHKIVPPVMKILVQDKELNIDGFLLPGHICAIIGTKPYEFLSEDYNIPGVVTGFEPLDILQGLNTLVNLISKKNYRIMNEYKRVVKTGGNPYALEYLNKTFNIVDSSWRGIGRIHASGMEFNSKYDDFDAFKHFEIEYEDYDGSPGCKCGEILKGKIKPNDCPLFKKICSPENPVGSCMVSSEGTCAAYYRYHKDTI
ncbi:hydrogenase formation protein HypD [Clostridium estertheticum]|uniref:hydrogenase formation protein HypD n=1 Tax=Clostridium estertheticum TaxID=238834 RepID=UPI001C6E5231|nr:hydrogenase formation protein HypD [Clostridium estertheticum]MBW9172172.1 hydrogenase formation protein HypD [Clostridium estertheticum]WLC76331.1 hydrogenase formation protein HypD [Clostridium estertheticum]